MIAFPNGALPETVDHGRTGFLVEDVDEMAAAIGRAGRSTRSIAGGSPASAFPRRDDFAQYLAVYERLSGRRQAPAVLEGAA